MLPLVKKLIPFCPLTSKSTKIKVYSCFGLFSLVSSDWSVYISLQIHQTTFSLEKAILWIKDCSILEKVLKLMDWFLSNMLLFASQDVNWWMGVVRITRSPLILITTAHSDGTHSLQRIHWWASVVVLNFSKPILMKKQTHLHLEWPGRVKFQQIFIFGWTIPSRIVV